MAANANTITYSYNVDARIRFDPLYVRTVSGILKVAALVIYEFTKIKWISVLVSAKSI